MKTAITLRPGASATDIQTAIAACEWMLAEIRLGGPVKARYVRVKETKVRAHTRPQHIRRYFARKEK